MKNPEESETYISEDGQVVVTNMSLDDLFIAMQPDEKSKEEAREWLKITRNETQKLPTRSKAVCFRSVA